MEYYVIGGVAALLVVLCIVGFAVYRKRANLEFNIPFLGIHLKFRGRGHQREGAKIKEAVSREGGIQAEDHTGCGAVIEKVEAKGDIRASSNPSSDPPYPKA